LALPAAGIGSEASVVAPTEEKIDGDRLLNHFLDLKPSSP
jgi:hypothetical protein